MRIIHTADWHIGKLLCDYSMLSDQEYFFDIFINELAELKPDALIVAGDIYDRSIPSGDAVNLLNNVLNKIVLELKIPTFIIAGNHDSKERLSFGTSFLEKNNLYIESNISENMKMVSIDSELTINFYMLPYFELYNIKNLYKGQAIQSINDAIKLYVKNIQLNKSQINILVGHGFYLYSKSNSLHDEISVGGAEIIDASLFDEFDYIALGHIHSSKSIGTYKMRYSGSPLKYSIDEANQDKSYTIIDIEDKNNIKIYTKPIIPLRDVRVIKGAFEDISNTSLQQNKEDYVFASLTDKNYILGAMSKLKAIFPNILGLSYDNIKLDNKLTDLNSLHLNKNETSMFCDFFKQVNCCDVNQSQLKIIRQIFDELKKESIENDTSET